MPPTCPIASLQRAGASCWLVARFAVLRTLRLSHRRGSSPPPGCGCPVGRAASASPTAPMWDRLGLPRHEVVEQDDHARGLIGADRQADVPTAEVCILGLRQLLPVGIERQGAPDTVGPDAVGSVALPDRGAGDAGGQALPIAPLPLEDAVVALAGNDQFVEVVD